MKRYNLSQIMKRAHQLHRMSWNMTFSEALKESWKRAKQEVALNEKVNAIRSKEDSKKKSFYNKFQKTISRQYANVTYGKNDWSVSYGRRYF